MKNVLYIFAAIAAIGVLLSVMLHAAAVLGFQDLRVYTLALYLGAIIVLLPVKVAADRFTKNVPWKDRGKAALRDCPKWMRSLSYLFFGYALVSFAIVAIMVLKKHRAVPLLPEIVGGFSAVCMAQYFSSFAKLYSAAKLWDERSDRYCSNGHTVQPFQKSCDQCGWPITQA